MTRTRLKLRAELELAIRSVRQAAVACDTIQATMVDSETVHKRDRSPVTVADFACQALVCAAISDASAVKAVVGEENSDALRGEEATALRDRVVGHVNTSTQQNASAEQVLDWIDSGNHDPKTDARYWTLDPIDGTKGFLRGGHYAIALALIDEGEVQLAVLGCPGWDRLLCAIRGKGARQMPLGVGEDTKGNRVRVAEATNLRFCESVEPGHSNQGWSAQIAERVGISAPPLRMDSQAKYAAVARGDAAIYLRLPVKSDYQEKIWDHAAGMHIVNEAGGRVTDINGADLDFSRGRTLAANEGVVATNGAVHSKVIAAIQSTK